MKKRLVLFAMALCTAWSVWAYAQAGHASHPPSPAPAPTEAREGEGGEHGTARDEESEAPGAINWADFGSRTPPFAAMLVNFGILMAGYYLLGKKPIAAALRARRDSIARDIEEAQRMRKEAEERAKTYQAKLDRLEDELKTARDALVRAGEAERDRLVADAEAKAERMRKDAEFLVEQEMKQIRVDLQREAVEAAIAAAEELLKKRVTQADQERIADEYLNDLGTKGRPAAGGVS